MDKSNSHKEKEKAWIVRLAEAAEYSGSIREYCKDEGLSIHSFRYWRRKLTRQAKKQSVLQQPFARVEIQSPVVETKPDFVLPDPRWVAEVMLHLQRGLR